MQPQNDGNHITFPSLPESNINKGSDVQQSDIQFVINSPDKAQNQDIFTGIIFHLENASDNQANEGNKPVYHSIPMPGNQDVMMLTSSLQNHENHHYVPPTKDGDNDGLANKREEECKDQNENQPIQNKEKKKFKKIRSLCRNINEAKVRKILNPLLLFLSLVNLGLLIALVVHQKGSTDDANFKPVTSALSYIGSNLQSHPILDIKLQDSDDEISCPEGYKSVLLGVWPGMVHGCDCSYGLRTGKCRRTVRSPRPDPSCGDISPRNPINMYDWGGSKWCVLRAKPGSQYVKKAKCPENFKKCSSGICVLKTLDCPVTKVKIESGAIVLEKTPKESPVIDLVITPNDIPCFSDAYFARGSVNPYVLIDQNENGCGKYGLDEDYSFKMDSQKQDKLFDENDFPKNVLNLPRYAGVYEKTDSVLSYRKRLSVAEKDLCLDIDTEILEKSSKAIYKLKDFLIATSVMSLTMNSIILVSVVSMMIVLRSGFKSFGYVINGEASMGWMFWYGLFGLCEYVMIIVMLASTAHFRAKILKTEGYLNELARMGCFLDQQAQSVVSDYQNVVDVEAEIPFKYSLALFFIMSFIWVSSMCLLCKSCEKGTRLARRLDLENNANWFGRRLLAMGERMYRV